MRVYVLVTAVSTGAFLVPPAVLMVRSGRETSREYIARLDEMKRSYEKIDEDVKRSFGPYSEELQQRIEKSKKEDAEWHAREVRTQQEWLARPFYRQLALPPFPDFANVHSKQNE